MIRKNPRVWSHGTKLHHSVILWVWLNRFVALCELRKLPMKFSTFCMISLTSQAAAKKGPEKISQLCSVRLAHTVVKASWWTFVCIGFIWFPLQITREWSSQTFSKIKIEIRQKWLPGVPPWKKKRKCVWTKITPYSWIVYTGMLLCKIWAKSVI